jgi:hypothetical protein
LEASQDVYYGKRSRKEMITLALLERRITDLERLVARQRAASLEVHEIETVPCVSQDMAGADMLATHTGANVNKVFVVPFKFSGRMNLRRASLICAAITDTTSIVGMCLYRLDSPKKVSTSSPRLGVPMFLIKIGSGNWVETSGTTHVRLNLNFTRPIKLDTSSYMYFAAWSCDSVNGTVFCPNAGPGSRDVTKSFVAAYATDGTASPSAGFPARLLAGSDTDVRAAPCVIGRSLSGLRVFGSFTDDA